MIIPANNLEMEKLEMKRTIKLTVFTLIFTFSVSLAFAQHCQFDGGNMIAVHLTDAEGKPITNISKNLTLVEINNPVADSCSYAKGILEKDFLPTEQELHTHYENYWQNWIKPDYRDWILLGDGYYAVILNQAEKSCMIKKGNDFKYRTREFEIKLEEIGLPQTIKVKKENIYSLCTGGGSWTRIKPFEIKVKNR